MKNQKNAISLYKVGIVFGVLGLLGGIYLIFNGVIIRNHVAEYAARLKYDEAIVELVAVYYIIAGVWALVGNVVNIALGKVAINALNEIPPRKGIHVALLVLSILFGGIFYFIGSILAIAFVNGFKPEDVQRSDEELPSWLGGNPTQNASSNADPTREEGLSRELDEDPFAEPQPKPQEDPSGQPEREDDPHTEE